MLSLTGAEIVWIGGTSSSRTNDPNFHTFSPSKDFLHHRRGAIRTIELRLRGLGIALRIRFHLAAVRRGRVRVQPKLDP